MTSAARRRRRSMCAVEATTRVLGRLTAVGRGPDSPRGGYTPKRRHARSLESGPQRKEDPGRLLDSRPRGSTASSTRARDRLVFGPRRPARLRPGRRPLEGGAPTPNPTPTRPPSPASRAAILQLRGAKTSLGCPTVCPPRHHVEYSSASWSSDTGLIRPPKQFAGGGRSPRASKGAQERTIDMPNISDK